MGYLFFQIWVWILAAFVLGWVSHWLLCCRSKDQAQDDSAAHDSRTKQLANQDEIEVVSVEHVTVDESWKPQGFASAPSDTDDLKRIKGVGSVIEETLNDLGIYQFKQIASWEANNVSWIENFLAFPGRIGRENWIEQAKTLHEGGTTEFAKRVDKGDVDYN